MDVPTPQTGDGETLSIPVATPATTLFGADAPYALFINSEPGYPNRIAISRYFKDAHDAVRVRRLAWPVLGLPTDGLLHFGKQGTFIVFQEMAQTKLWGREKCDMSLLTSLVQPMNQWTHDRVEILKGKRALEKRIAQSDAALDEFGYPDLRRTLLSLAGRKPMKLQILDTAGHGGTLDIPPRGNLVPVSKIDEPPQQGGVAEVLGMEEMTQILDLSGFIAETLTTRVSDDVIEGGLAFLRHPHRTSVRSCSAQRMDVVQQD